MLASSLAQRATIMSGRIRNPSVRALEAQRDAYTVEELDPPPQRPSRKQKTAATTVSAPAPSRRGNALIRGLDIGRQEDVDMSAPASQEEQGEGEKDPDFTLCKAHFGSSGGLQSLRADASIIVQTASVSASTRESSP